MNLRLAVRSLFKNPFVTVIAIVSLGLGIGANAAIFSLFDQILLRNLPVPEPERLVNFSSPGPRDGNTSCFFIGGCDDVFSYPMFHDLQEVQTSFTGIAAQRFYNANLSYENQTQSGLALWVSGSYFPVLDLRPAVGRLIEPLDEQVKASVVVLSHSYWRARFNENPSVLNQKLIVNGQPMTIVGVAPEGFNGTTVGMTPNVFAPVTTLGAGWSGIASSSSSSDLRRNYSIYLFGRLKPGLSIEEAAAAINGPYHHILNEVEAALQRRMTEQTLVKFKARTLTLEPGKHGQSELHEQARVPLTLLIGVTAFVLLIACANIANLLLARAATRAGEMAIRLSIGGTRWQLIVQLLTEASLLAALGGAFSLVVARWTLDLIASFIRPELAPVELAGIQYSLDTPAVLFAALLTLGTGILFGLFPALHSSRPDLVSAFKGNSGQAGGSRTAARFRWSLATTQIALSMALLILAGLFTKSLFNASHADLGFRTENLITFSLSPRLNGYSRERSVALYERIEDELRAIPGVIGVTSSNVGLFAGDETAELWETRVRVQGFPFALDVNTNARFAIVGADYFGTLGIPLIAGRDFTQFDNEVAPKVAIVNERFVEKFNLGSDAIGKRIGAYGAPLDTEIIGVARDAKYSELRAGVQPEFFFPYRQRFEFTDNNFYVRAAGNSGRILGAIPSLIARINSNVALDRLRAMPEQIQAYITVSRVTSVLSVAFAAVATLLAAIGLYGVLAYTMVQRTKEIGIRMALGADRSRVQRMVLGQVGWMTVIGGMIGFAVGLALGRFGESLLFQLNARDPLVLCLSGFLLVLVTFAAGLIPARRASRLDPLNALRYE
jgi:predicted permease